MITLGLTGMSGSGKSYVANIFSQYGIPTINADAIVHQLYAGNNECTRKLKVVFGDRVLNPDHSINRKALGAIVFANRDMLHILNETVHPLVIKEMRDCIEKARNDGEMAVILDAPQLFEAHLDSDCDYIISVIADEKTRLKRIAIRDGIDTSAAKARLANQYSDAFFKENSDFCINNSMHQNPEEQVISILKTLGLIYEQ